jgi:hypothetical protein
MELDLITLFTAVSSLLQLILAAGITSVWYKIGRLEEALINLRKDFEGHLKRFYT